MYVYMLAKIYTYTYMLNAICISRTTKQNRLGNSSLFMHRGGASKLRSIQSSVVSVSVNEESNAHSGDIPRDMPMYILYRVYTLGGIRHCQSSAGPVAASKINH